METGASPPGPPTDRITIRHGRTVRVVNGAVIPVVCAAGGAVAIGTAGGALSALLVALATVQLAIAWRPALRIDPDGVVVRNAVRRRRLSHGDVEALRAAPTGDAVEEWVAEHPRARWRVDVELADGSSLPAAATERRRTEYAELRRRLGAVAATYGIPLTEARRPRGAETPLGTTITVRRGSADRIYYGIVTPVLATGLVVAYWIWWGAPWGFEVLIPIAALAYAAGTLLPELRIAPTGLTVRNVAGWSRTFGFNEIEELSCCRLRHASGSGGDGSAPGLKIRLADGGEIEVSATRRLSSEHRKLADEVAEVLAHYQVPLDRGDCCPGSLR